MSKTIHIASFIVSVMPQHLMTARHALLAMPGVEITQEDGKGKLIIVIEADSDAGVSAFINQAHQIQGIADVSFVYHESDTEEALAKELT